MTREYKLKICMQSSLSLTLVKFLITVLSKIKILVIDAFYMKAAAAYLSAALKAETGLRSRSRFGEITKLKKK